MEMPIQPTHELQTGTSQACEQTGSEVSVCMSPRLILLWNDRVHHIFLSIRLVQF